MKNFLRAVRLALHYRLTLAGVLCCSLLVAVFWGGNIGGVYPIVEVAIKGKSLQAWVAEKIASTEAKSAELRREIERLEKAPPPNGKPLEAAAQDVAFLHRRLQAEEAAAATARWLQPWIDRYLPADPFRTVVWIVVALMAATAVKDFFLFANNMLVERVVQMVSFDLRKQLYHHMLRMDLGEFGEQRTGTMMSRFNVDLGYLSTGLSTLFGRAILEPLKGLACLIGAAFVCWRLLLFSLLLAPLAGFLIRTLARSIKRANRRALEENAQLMGVLSEAFHGMQTVQAFTMEKHERNRFHKVSKACLQKAMKIAFYNVHFLKPATEILGLGMVFIALIAGAYLVLNQATHILGIPMCDRPLEWSVLLVFYGLLIGTSDPARKLSDVVNGIQGGLAAADRIFPLLDRQPTIVDPEHPRPAPRPHRRLVFDHVHFHYTPDQPVLRDIHLAVEYGETLCIVGPNGCGKTTLSNLLLRFHDPVAGAMRLDDIDLREMRRDLPRLVGMVTQQTMLFDDTVYNNIRYGSLQATREEIIAAAQRAHAHRFIEDKLEHGYDTVVGPGGNRLSGGQRQRIALARAILRDPDILILDEATSQIDIESEQQIHLALEQFVRGRTAIIVTHRLATLDLADRILVMDAGRIVDLGTHDELVRRCDLYRRLYDIQLRQTA